MVLRLHDSARFFPPLAVPVFCLLAGCASNPAQTDTALAPIDPAGEAKESTVQLVNFVHQVHFAAGSITPAAAEFDALDGFMVRLAPHYGERVRIDSGALTGNPGADALAVRRAQAVAAELRRVGAATVEIEQAGNNADHDAVGVSVSRYVANGPKCPDWNDRDPNGFGNGPSSNFGCATGTNLGAMVANPADLIRGSEPGPADAEFVARGVQRYRNGELSKSLEPELSNGNAGGGAK
jgi:pilus assembly protein CpaD